jgi:hypothetical protein
MDAPKAVILIFTVKRASNLTGYDCCQTLKTTAEKGFWLVVSTPSSGMI